MLMFNYCYLSEQSNSELIKVYISAIVQLFQDSKLHGYRYQPKAGEDNLGEDNLGEGNPWEGKHLQAGEGNPGEGNLAEGSLAEVGEGRQTSHRKGARPA